MIKILHSADIHLDSPLTTLALRDPALRDRVQAATRQALQTLVDVALEETVAALLIAGDLFDGAVRSAKTAAFLTHQMDRLADADIPVFYIKGNHDAENPITGEIELPGNVHIFDGRGGKVQVPGQDVWIHGVSFASKHAPDSLLGKFGSPVPGAVNIAMLHTSLAGAAGHDPYAPCSVADLSGMGFDYWALGHVHKRQVHAATPWIVMPGMPQGRDIGEDGPKSATLLEIDGAEIKLREVPTSTVVFLHQSLDVTGIDTSEDLRAALRDLFRDLAARSGGTAHLVRLTLSGATSLSWQILRDRAIWEESAQTLAQAAGAIWLEKLALAVTEPAGDQSAASATAELATLMAQIAAEDGFATARDAEVEALLSELPKHRHAALLPDAKAARTLAETLAQDGAAQVLARMKGAAG